MNTVFLEQFLNDLDLINSDHTLKLIADCIRNVESVKKPQDIKGIKKLKGHPDAYRIRIGSYRIGLFINKGTAEFVRIALRRDIYLKFP
jgi:mRNA interferase RelE/StbE